MSIIKSIYQKPSIKVKKVEADNILAAVSVGGNTGIGYGEGDDEGGTPTSGTAKRSLFDNDESSNNSFMNSFMKE